MHSVWWEPRGAAKERGCSTRSWLCVGGWTTIIMPFIFLPYYHHITNSGWNFTELKQINNWSCGVLLFGKLNHEMSLWGYCLHTTSYHLLNPVQVSGRVQTPVAVVRTTLGQKPESPLKIQYFFPYSWDLCHCDHEKHNLHDTLHTKPCEMQHIAWWYTVLNDTATEISHKRTNVSC